MWTSRKGRFQQAGSRPKAPESRLNFPHMRRVMARIQSGSQIFDAQVLLNDVSERGLRLFSSVPLNPGSMASITLFEPRSLAVKARVIERAAPMRQGHIVSQRTFPHRLSLRFVFSSDDERRAVAEFVRELQEQHGIRATAPITVLEFQDAFV